MDELKFKNKVFLKENVPPVKRLPVLRKVRWVAAGRVNRPTPAVRVYLGEATRFNGW